MRSIVPAPTIFLHTDATDMRKSFTGLCGLIRGVFGDDPADGSLFLFVNQRRDRIKALWWDGDGFVLWYKRLEQGTFEVVPARDVAKRVRIDATQFAMVLGGVRLDTALEAAFRKKIERYTADPSQLKIDFGNSAEVADAAEGIADAALEAVEGYNRRKQKPVKARNEQLPAHLPRIEVLLPVPEDQRFCPEHGERTVAGFDWQESLQIVPAKLVVVRTGIPKCVCKGYDECGVVEAPRPVGLVEGNRYDTSVAAQIITHKYSYHLPICRQQDIFASCGWTPARSTLLNILRAAAECIAVFVAHLREVVRAGPIIGTDDTTVTLLTPSDLPPLDPLDPKSTRTREVIAAAHADARKSITARMWAYRGITVPINVFDFTVSRHRDGPKIFLDGFTGKLMADCYSGYDAVEMASDGRIVRAAFVAHARRKVFDARSNHPTHAAVLLSMFQQLYDIEDRAKTFSLIDRQGLRQAEAKPIWERMREYINGDAVQDVLPKDTFGQALTPRAVVPPGSGQIQSGPSAEDRHCSQPLVAKP